VINVEPNEIEDHVKDCVRSWHSIHYFGSVMFNLQMELIFFLLNSYALLSFL
jgi:hypothetical protein